MPIVFILLRRPPRRRRRQRQQRPCYQGTHCSCTTQHYTHTMRQVSARDTRTWICACFLVVSVGYVKQQKFIHDSLQQHHHSDPAWSRRTMMMPTTTTTANPDPFMTTKSTTVSSLSSRRIPRTVNEQIGPQPPQQQQEQQQGLVSTNKKRLDDKASQYTAVTAAQRRRRRRRRPQNHGQQQLSQNHTCSIGNNNTLSFPQSPSFIIIGAQKSGTSALAALLKMHPDIVGPGQDSTKPFELHFFDWMVPKREVRLERMKEMGLTSEDELFCHYSKQYSSNFDLRRRHDNVNNTATTNNKDENHVTSLASSSSSSSSPPLLSFEKTPSYLFHGYYLPEIVLKVCPWKPKLVALLRNPVDRAVSQYQMDRHHGGSNTKQKSFEDLINEEVAAMKSFGLTNAPLLNEWDPFHDNKKDDNGKSPYDFSLPPLTEHQVDVGHRKLFRRVFLSNYLQRGMYAVQLRKWQQSFGPSHLFVAKYEELYGTNIQHEFDGLTDFLGVDPMTVPAEAYDERVGRTKPLAGKTRLYLQRLFEPYNDLLCDVLHCKSRPVWSDIVGIRNGEILVLKTRLG